MLLRQADNPYASDVYAGCLVMAAEGAQAAGQDPVPLFHKALSQLEPAVQKNPYFLWGLNDLANVYLALGGYQQRHGDPAARGTLLKAVHGIVEAEGFKIHPDKTRVMRRGSMQTVTGVIVNDKPSICREELRRLRAILHRAKTEGLDAQNREGRPNFRAWLAGKIAFVSMVRPDVGAKLKAALDTLA